MYKCTNRFTEIHNSRNKIVVCRKGASLLQQKLLIRIDDKHTMIVRTAAYLADARPHLRITAAAMNGAD
jgi:hypothetical protein